MIGLLRKQGLERSLIRHHMTSRFYVILNLAVGGSWVGYPDEDAEFGDNAQFVIDYVKVYQKDSYETDVDKPETEVKLRDPDSDGNYIINGDFPQRKI